MKPIQKKDGKLICVGSGIRAIAHFTLEAQACIREADMVYISVADPVTVKWIQEQNPNHFDLYQYYANDRPRFLTYAQMTERMLIDVRAGKFVVAVFYGHPGVFVNPSHDAIAVARAEGYHAAMLPGVSAEDCLFADLGIDPSRVGLQTVEATDLLLRKREIQIDTNLIVWQVGCVGDVGFQFSGFENTSFPLLLDYLASYYGDDHKITNYIAPQYPTSDPVIEEYSIAELRLPENARKISGISTFFIAAKVNKSGDADMAAQMGLAIGDTPVTPFPQIDMEQYKASQQLAVQMLEVHEEPEGYPQPAPSEAAYAFMKGLAESYSEWLKFTQDRGAYIAAYPGLSDFEKKTLQLGYPGAIRMMMQKSAEREALRFVNDSIADAAMTQEYQELIRIATDELKEGRCSERQFLDSTRSWLVNRGYLTTVPHVTTTVQGLADAPDWTGTYQLYIETSPGAYSLGPLIILGSSSLTVDGITIQDYNLVVNSLSWSAKNGNPSSASLTFFVNTKTNANSFYGEYWTTAQPQPTDANAVGEAVSSAPLSNWAATYYTANLVGNKWTKDSKLKVSADGTVNYNQTIQNYTYGGNELSWQMADGNAQNVVIAFSTNKSGKMEFYGFKWTTGAKPAQANFSGIVGSGGGGWPPIAVAAVALTVNAQVTANAQAAATTAQATATTATATATATSATAATTSVSVTVAPAAAEKMAHLSRQAGLDVEKVKKATEALSRKLREIEALARGKESRRDAKL